MTRERRSFYHISLTLLIFFTVLPLAHSWNWSHSFWPFNSQQHQTPEQKSERLIRQGERYSQSAERKFEKHISAVEDRLDRWDSRMKGFEDSLERAGQRSSFTSIRSGGGGNTEDEVDELMNQFQDQHRLERGTMSTSPTHSLRRTSSLPNFPAAKGKSDAEYAELERRLNRLKFDQDTPPTYEELEARLKKLKEGSPVLARSNSSPVLGAKKPVTQVTRPTPHQELSQKKSHLTCFPTDETSNTSLNTVNTANDPDPLITKWKSNRSFFTQLTAEGKMRVLHMIMKRIPQFHQQWQSCQRLELKAIKDGKASAAVKARLAQRKKALKYKMDFYASMSESLGRMESLPRSELRPLENLRSHVAAVLSPNNRRNNGPLEHLTRVFQGGRRSKDWSGRGWDGYSSFGGGASGPGSISF